MLFPQFCNVLPSYLLRSIATIIGKLFHIIFILIAFTLIFASLGFVFWSNPSIDISASQYHFSYFRSIGQSIMTMTTLTTTVNFPDCMIDYVSTSFANFAFFLMFTTLSISFALQLLLSSVYETYQSNLKLHYSSHVITRRSALASAFQHLCDASMQLSRPRWRAFMRAYHSLADSKYPQNEAGLRRCDIHADFLFSMCCVKRRFVSDFCNVKQSFARDGVIDELRAVQFINSITEASLTFSDFVELCSLLRYKIVVKHGCALFAIKQMNGREIALADVLDRVAMSDEASYSALQPFSPHSSSYARTNIMSADANTASIEVSSFLQKLLHFPSEFFVAMMIPVKIAPPSKYRALAGRIHSNVAVRGLLSALIVCQFAVGLVQCVV